jgi:hypothetical protein
MAVSATRDLKINIIEGREGGGFLQVANDLDKVATSTETADAKTKQWAESSARLNDEIAKSKARIKELHEEVAKTGDTSLFGDIRKEETRLRNFENTFKALAPAVESSIGAAFSGIFDSFKDLPFKGILITTLVGAAVAAAPAVGAVLGGAVLGAGGLGGIAGGIFAASKNQNVRDAASALGSAISSQFFGSGESMVEPLVKGIQILQEDFAKLDLAKTFREVAPYVEAVAHGIGGLAGEFLPRFNDALQKGGPALAILAKLLPQVGVALGEMFQNLADSKGTFEGLAFGINLTVNLIKGLGKGLGWLGNQFDGMLRFADRATMELDAFLHKLHIAGPFLELLHKNLSALIGVGDGVIGMVGAVGTGLDNIVNPMKQAQRATQELKDEIKRLDDAARSYFNVAMSLDQADQAVAQSFLDLRNNLIKGKQNWADNTQAGHDNISMVQSAIDVLEQQREKAIDNANGNKAAVDKANASYESQLKTIIDIAKKAGDSQAALKALAGKYDVEVILHASLVDDIKGLGNVGKIASAVLASYFPHRASGGPVMAGQTYQVGEMGPELYTPTSNGVISPHGAGGGTQTLTGEVVFRGTGDRLVDAIFEAFRLKIRAGYSLT